jgi:hypothetical protein
MKKTFILLQASIIVLMLTFISFKASAQAFDTPSDAYPATAAPATAGAVGKVICAGGTISLSATTPNATSTYVWRKKNSSGAMVVVLGPGAAGANTTYSETPSAAGYYTYTVEEINSNTCSTISNPITVFVLPPLAPVIAGQSNVCASNQSTIPLTITGLDGNFQYSYQWTKNGTDIPGENLDHYTVSESTATPTINFAVRVSYVLNPSCTKTSADKAIAVIALPTPTITIN